MKRLKRSFGMLLAGTVAAAGVALVAAPAAQAAPIGTLTVSPASGDGFTALSVTTNTGCTSGTNFQTRISGGSIPSGTTLGINGNTPLSVIGATTGQAGPMTTPLSSVLDSIRGDNGGTLAVGTYTIEFVCRANLNSTSLGEFVGTLNITTAMTATSSGAYSAATSSVPTTSVLTAAPASPQNAGTSITFTDTVSASSTPSGSVQFMDGATPLGAPVTTVAGVATLATSALTAATHTITAVFTGGTGFGNSTSNALTYVINTAAATATTTTLAPVTPATGPAFQSVTLSATVTPAGAAGNVQFLDGTSVLGTVPNASGAVTFTTTALGQGPHSLSAKFVPTNVAIFLGSQSAAQSVTYDAAAFAPDPQTVTVNVPAGTLVISTPYTATAPFALGDLVLDPSGASYSVTKAFGDSANPNNGVTITDTRAGNPGWNASITSGDFTQGANVIDGIHLGFEGVAPVYISGNAISTTNPITVTSVPANTPGVKGGPHVFATATAGHGTGSVNVVGNLTLKQVPTSTQPGLYTAVVTFTIA